MKIYYQILLWTLLSGKILSQDISSDQLTAEFLSGRLFVFNDYALNQADSSFFKKVITAHISKIEHLDSISSFTEYGTIGKNGALRLQIDDLRVLKREEYRVVDASILKYFDESKQTFYFIDGLPNNDIYYALDGLVNKKIKEVKKMAPNQAQAIWGTQGKNGAIVINTDGRTDLPMK
jgi:hypothetical protein